MTSAPSLARLIGIAIATIAASTIGLPRGLAAQADMPSAEEVREALQTLRRFELALATADSQESLDPRGDEARPGPLNPEGPSRAVTNAGPSVSSAAPTFADASLSFDSQLHLAAGSSVFKDSKVFLWDDSSIGNLGLGSSALKHTTGTASRNTAVGYRALEYTAAGGGSYAYDFYASNNTALGYAALNANSDGYANTGVGSRALLANSSGSLNTAVGSQALRYNSTGHSNTAVGTDALYSNSFGSQNSALGLSALSGNLNGHRNVAIGYGTLSDNGNSQGNTAVGTHAMRFFGSGDHNTVIGEGALYCGYGCGGDRHIAIGYRAGDSNPASSSDNIFIANQGTGDETTPTTRIGTQGTQTRAFIAGIAGTTTDVNDAIPVLIDSAGQLGTVSSSARFKEDVHDLAEASSLLLDLRPVKFRYRKPFKNGGKPIQFGLIAEEVAEVFPELVVYNADGEPETVKYHLLSTLLLNEVKRQESEFSDLRHQMADRDRVVAELKRRLEQLSNAR